MPIQFQLSVVSDHLYYLHDQSQYILIKLLILDLYWNRLQLINMINAYCWVN